MCTRQAPWRGRHLPLAGSRPSWGLPHPGVGFSSFGLIVFARAFAVLVFGAFVHGLGEFSAQHEDKTIPKKSGI